MLPRWSGESVESAEREFVHVCNWSNAENPVPFHVNTLVARLT